MTDELKQTPLHAAHIEAGAKMVDFGGWHMPVQYEGILAEHKAVREDAGIFDVSHMGEVDFTGPKALDAIQRLITNDAGKLDDGQAVYTAVCLPSGGIVDDCIVYRRGAENYRIVVNASNIEKDFAHFSEFAGDLCDIQNHSDAWALLAVQGPRAPKVVADLAGAHLIDVPGFAFADGEVDGVKVTAARTGYTGEDGFEIFVPAEHARKVWDAVLAADVKPIGLGARDTLRLEAKLCLYGNDIDETTTPLEAALGWTVKLAKGEFVGSEALAAQKEKGIDRKLIGFRVLDRGIARHGAEVIDGDGNVIGNVTSGAPAPTVGGAVGMAYVPIGIASPGNEITLRQRKKTFEAEIHKGPFYRRAKK
jgi:aminomethyltransferase